MQQAFGASNCRRSRRRASLPCPAPGRSGRLYAPPRRTMGMGREIRPPAWGWSQGAFYLLSLHTPLPNFSIDSELFSKWCGNQSPLHLKHEQSLCLALGHAVFLLWREPALFGRDRNWVCFMLTHHLPSCSMLQLHQLLTFFLWCNNYTLGKKRDM